MSGREQKKRNVVGEAKGSQKRRQIGSPFGARKTGKDTKNPLGRIKKGEKPSQTSVKTARKKKST